MRSQSVAQFKSKIGVAFHREGFTLKKDAVDYLIGQLRQHAPEYPDFLKDLLVNIDRQSLSRNIVDLAALRKAVEVVTADVVNKVEQISLQVLNALDIPRFTYNGARKTFSAIDTRIVLHGSAHDQSQMLRERFELLRQRLLRHELFAPGGLVPNGDAGGKNFELTNVEALVGSQGRKVVLGMLTRDRNGSYVLEDLNNTVKIDVSNAKIVDGYYTDNCFVLADGELRGGLFHVDAIAMPSIELRKTTLETFPSIDLFGATPDPSYKEEIAMYELNAEDVLFVCLADVHLDKPVVMKKLETLFRGFEDIVPTAFIFQGNFLSKPFAQAKDDAEILQQAFQRLTKLIQQFPTLAKESKWIFSRGPTDAGGPLVYPQFELPPVFTRFMKQKLGDQVMFATNPFRIRWCNKRMIFFRENLIGKMKRHSLFPLSPEADLAHTLVKTVLAQSHLCPMPQSIAPIYWGADQSLRVYPIPEFLALSDHYDQWVAEESGCHAFNPGSFSSDFSFVVVRPATDDPVEESHIPEDDSIPGDEGPLVEDEEPNLDMSQQIEELRGEHAEEDDEEEEEEEKEEDGGEEGEEGGEEEEGEAFGSDQMEEDSADADIGSAEEMEVDED